MGAAIDRLLSARDIAERWGITEQLAGEWMNAGRFGPVYGTRRVRRVTEEGFQEGTRRMQVGAASRAENVTDLPVRGRQRGRARTGG